MKKIIASLLIGIMLFGLCACGKKDTATVSDAPKAGTLTYLSADEEQISEEVVNKVIAASTMAEDRPKIESVFYDSLTSMQMALEKGAITSIIIGRNVANYMVNHDKYVKIEDNQSGELNGYAFLLTDKNGELCNKLSDAIVTLKANGKLAELEQTYIKDVIAGSDIPKIEMPNFDGADTITVAVTGDLPPMDYVAEDGSAAGFNTALLAAVAEELQINIQIIQIDSGARSMALSTGKADVCFWARATFDEDAISEEITNDEDPLGVPFDDMSKVSYATYDKPDGTIMSEIYYMEDVVSVVLNND